MIKINPRQINAMMKQLGIKMKSIEAIEVIIKCDDKEIIIRRPEISRMNFMGKEVFR